jgi:NADH:ubiquinone oxidoreductase subunit B-like Fe-S oxidoreductase
MATPSPKWVVALGDCAVDGGCFAGSYAVVGGVSRVVPVDLQCCSFSRPVGSPEFEKSAKNVVTMTATVQFAAAGQLRGSIAQEGRTAYGWLRSFDQNPSCGWTGTTDQPRR